MVLTESQAVAIGSDLGKFIEGDSWSVTLQVLEETLTNRILTSKISDKEGREQAFMIHVALQELIATINSIVLQAGSIAAEWEYDKLLNEE